MSSLLSFTFWSSLLLVAAQLAAGFAFPEQVWGLHHLAFMPVPLTAALVVVVLLLLILARCGPIAWLESGCSLLWRLPKFALFGVIPLAALAICYFFRIRHLLLGDAAIVNQLGKTPPAFSWLGKNDPFVHYLLYDLLAHWFSLEIWSVFALVSCIAGAVFAAAAIGVANTGKKHRGSQLFVLVALTGTGAMQLFCGYVEYYTLMSLFLALALVSLMHWQGNRTGALLLAILSWSAAFMLHPIASCLGPAIALAVGFHLWKSPWPAPKRRAMLGMLGIASLGGVVYWLFHVAASQPLLLSPSQAYPLLGADHLRDALNEYLLLVPLHGPLILFLLWRQRRELSWQDPVLVCLGVAAAASWGTSFLIDPLLGSLDWDLLSVYAFPLTALTAYLVGRQADSSLHTLRSSLCFAAAALLQVLPWVSANTDAQRAGRMVEAMVAEDAHYRGSGNTMLAVKFQALGMMDEAVRQYYKSLQWNPGDHVAYHNLGWIYYPQEKTHALGVEMFQRFLQTAPAGADTRMAQSITAFDAGNGDLAAGLCVSFLFDHPQFSVKALDYARNLLAQETKEEYRGILQVALLYADDQAPAALEMARDLANTFPGNPVVAGMYNHLQHKVGSEQP